MKTDVNKLQHGMNKEEIIATIEKLKSGAIYRLEYRDGAVLNVGQDLKLVSTITMDARFKINYANTKLAIASEAIRRADSAEKLVSVEQLLAGLNAEEQRCLPSNLQAEYLAKRNAMANQQPLWLTSKRRVSRNIDEAHPYLVHCNNGSIQLSVNRAYRWDLQKKALAGPERKYYLINKDKVGEISSDQAGVLQGLAQEARTQAGKKDSAPSSFYSINIQNICAIY